MPLVYKKKTSQYYTEKTLEASLAKIENAASKLNQYLNKLLIYHKFLLMRVILYWNMHKEQLLRNVQGKLLRKMMLRIL